MNYIVVDFEWNQTSYGKGSENRKIPFEIIEIGAVKLNEKRKEVDRFSRTIRPKVYKKLHYITKELTGITQEELNVSDPFTYVLVDFMLWCGKDYTFCTWGNMDLVELQRNMKYYGLLDLLKGPVKYYNVQKLFRELCAHDTAAASLETAVDYFELPKSEDFHRAVNDAAYTAEIFRRVDREAAKKLYSIDYYQNPQTKKEEIHLRYDSYYKYISRVFEDAINADGRPERGCTGFLQRQKHIIVWQIARSMDTYGARSVSRRMMNSVYMLLKHCG